MIKDTRNKGQLPSPLCPLKMNIILCGMPGSGKSSFGALAAQKLNRPFIDTDQQVVFKYLAISHEKTTCREIRLEKGEAFFRCLENQVVRELKPAQPSIIAIGGGTLCATENVEILKKLGWMIYLKASPQLLLKRLMNKRPLPSYLDQHDIEGSFDALLKQRLPLYEQYCHDCIDVESENVVKIIIKKVLLG